MIEKGLRKIPGTNVSIPLSIKKAIIILNYNAKFGIKGSSEGQKAYLEHQYELTIPKYKVIGVEVPDNQNIDINYMIQED